MDKPVTRKDLIKTLSKFFETVIAPYLEEHVIKRLDNHEKRFNEIDCHLDIHGRQFEKIIDRFDRHSKMWEDHEKRIKKMKAFLFA